MAQRSVIVDDPDPSIKYEGSSWFADQGHQDRVGNFGPPFRSTLHGTQKSASLSFQFYGTSVLVVGANIDRNVSGVVDPTWECFVDHISIGASEFFQFPENNWPFCEQDPLVDGLHTLTVNVTVKDYIFWLDRIQYTPSHSVSTENLVIYIENNDPELQFGSGWRALGDTANMTQTKGAEFEFEFTGVSLSWFSFVPSEFPGKATTGSYTIDGSTAQSFSLNGYPAKSKQTVYNQKFFETPTLPMGRHKISVVYNGDSNTTPLTLDYLVVQNGTAAPNSTGGGNNNNYPGRNGTSASSSSNTGGGNKSNNPIPAKKTNIGAIVGGIIPAAVILLLAFFFLRRWRRQQNKSDRDQNPRITQNHPFVAHQSHSLHPPAPTGVSGGITPPNVKLHRSIPSAARGNRSDLHSASGIGATSSRNGSPGLPLFEKARAGISLDSRGTSRIIMHEDSGVRNLQNPAADEDVVEPPPRYTTSG